VRRYQLHFGAWLALGASIGIYFVISVGLHQPFHVGLRPLRFFDLRVYRGAGWRVLHDSALYRRPIVRHLGFTYPPFAALALAPLSLFSLAFERLAVTFSSLGALVWTLRRALTMKRANRRYRKAAQSAGTAWAIAALAAAAALWLEPITVTLGYGQIDIFVAALVVFDLSRPDCAATKGAAIGLAAAVKLTPLLFLVYLLFSRRRRAGLVGALTFLATIAVSFVAVPADTERYWTRVVFHSSRIGGAADLTNQSLRGGLARFLAERHPGVEVVVVVAALAIVGLLLAVRLSRRGDEATGFSLCAITALLVSPVSWTHHWAIAVPALLLLAVAAYENRSPLLWVCTAGALAVGYAYLPEREANHRGRRLLVAHQALHGGLHTLAQDPYVLIGLLALGLPAATLARGWWPSHEPLPTSRERLLTRDLQRARRRVAFDIAGGVEDRAGYHRGDVPVIGERGGELAQLRGGEGDLEPAA
jgi:alpha-1,2-mannosyltransferase